MSGKDTGHKKLYCMNCGSELTSNKTDRGVFYACPDRSCFTGRNFAIAENIEEESFCSCDWGRSVLRVTDYGTYKLFKCPICRMKLIVVVDDKRIEGIIEGTDSNDVSRVVKDTLTTVGIAGAALVDPDKVYEDLQVVKSTFENDLRYDLLRLYEACKSQHSGNCKARRKEIKKRISEIGTELKKWLKEHPNENPMFTRDEQHIALLAEHHRLAIEIRSLYNREYHGIESEIANRISNQLRAIRPEYRIAKNPEFGNLSPDLIDPLFGLNAEIKVIDDRDDYWVAKGIKQALSYCEVGRFNRAQFILVNFSPNMYLVTDEIRQGKLGGRVDIVIINISDPPSSNMKPITIDKESIVNFLDIGGAGMGYFIDNTEFYMGGRDFQLDVEDIDKEIT